MIETSKYAAQATKLVFEMNITCGTSNFVRSV